MGSPISSTIAEIYLQYFEERLVKHWMEKKEIIYYKWYVDDMLMIFKQTTTKEETIMTHMNNIHKHLHFKMTEEINNTTNYLDLHIHRTHEKILLGIYRKLTQTGTTIGFISNHSLQHKFGAYIFYINRLLSTPITEQEKQHEWNTICTMAKNNAFPLLLIHSLQRKLTNTQHNTTPTDQHS